MKKLFLILAMVLMASTALAARFQWDQHTNTSVRGYLLQWSETTDPPEVFSINVPGITTTQAEIADNLFKLDVQYDVWLKAYNFVGASNNSNIVQLIKQGYTPPADNLPTEIFDAPGAVINFINQ